MSGFIEAYKKYRAKRREKKLQKQISKQKIRLAGLLAVREAGRVSNKVYPFVEQEIAELQEWFRQQDINL